MIIMYVVQAVQTIGDVSSTAIGGFNREATDKEIGGAIKGQGICGMLGACIGGLPTDPYSQNVGLIVTTKVVAKRVFMIVGVIMLAAGLVPKFGAVMTTIPYPVLGGATITVFAAITMSGIQLITQQPLNYRNKMIVGIALAIGVGVSTVSTSLQFFPMDVQNIIGKSPIVLSFLISFLLNIIVPKDETKEEE
jgi:NCS2 family nucleobase:cation symporter-2